MKTTLITFILCLLLQFVRSQTIQSLGLRAGISVANQNWHYERINSNNRKDSRGGFFGALTMESFRGQYLSFILDLGYCQKGSSEKIEQVSESMPEGTGVFVTYKNRFNYAFISPMIKARHEIGRFNPYVVLGPRIDFQTSYESDFDYSLIEKNFRTVIYGLTYGAGAEFKFTQIGLYVDVQRQVDFTHLMKTESTSDRSGMEITNSCFTFSTGIRYYFKQPVKEDVE